MKSSLDVVAFMSSAVTRFIVVASWPDSDDGNFRKRAHIFLQKVVLQIKCDLQLFGELTLNRCKSLTKSVQNWPITLGFEFFRFSKCRYHFTIRELILVHMYCKDAPYFSVALNTCVPYCFQYHSLVPELSLVVVLCIVLLSYSTQRNFYGLSLLLRRESCSGQIT